MIFTEPIFFGFFLIVLGFHWALSSQSARKLWLLFASYFFYAAWDWRFLYLIVGSTAVDYIVGRVLANSTPRFGRRFWLYFSLCANLGILGFFKYFDFFVVSASGLLSWIGIEIEAHTLGLILPVGISFFTFQSMSYTIDVYRGSLKPIRNATDFALYVSFFPQLVAGPIVRATEFLPQLEVHRRFADVNVRAALNLFLIGFVKKACIADGFAPYVDQIYQDTAAFESLSVWIGVLFYSVQIYCDFSGYSDMAIACAALLGYTLPKNFDFPYFATNITEFWRRWHISLSTWLRDYLYVPLGGRSSSHWKTRRNLMLTMLLGGLWHGAGWNYVIWGALHGFALVAIQMIRTIRPSLPRAGLAALPNILATFLWVATALVFFRAQSFDSAIDVLRSMVFAGDGTKTLTKFGDAPLLLLLIPVVATHMFLYRNPFRGWTHRVSDGKYAALLGLAVFAALTFVSIGKHPFIYFQF